MSIDLFLACWVTASHLPVHTRSFRRADATESRNRAEKVFALHVSVLADLTGYSGAPKWPPVIETYIKRNPPIRLRRAVIDMSSNAFDRPPTVNSRPAIATYMKN